MKNIDELLHKIMSLAHVQIQDKQKMAQKLNLVIDYVAQLETMQISSDPCPDEHRLTPDTVRPHLTIDRDQLLRNIPAQTSDGVWVPKFVDKKDES